MNRLEYRDVNKEKYMKALFLDIQKQTKMVDLENRAELIHDFVVNNPSNSDSSKSQVSADGIRTRNGFIIIQPVIAKLAESLTKKKKKKS